MPDHDDDTHHPSHRCGRCRHEFALEPGADPRTAADWWACAPCRGVLLPNRAP